MQEIEIQKTKSSFVAFVNGKKIKKWVFGDHGDDRLFVAMNNVENWVADKLHTDLSAVSPKRPVASKIYEMSIDDKIVFFMDNEKIAHKS